MFTFLNNYVTVQIFSFVVQLTVLSGSFGNLKIAIAESQNQLIFSAENLAGNPGGKRFVLEIFLEFARPITLI